LKDSLAKGLGVGFKTLLGPLRLIVDPILDLGGTSSQSLFDKIIEKSNETESARDSEMLERFDDLAAAYNEDEDRKKKGGKVPKGKKGGERDDDFEALLKGLGEPVPETSAKPKRKSKKPEKPEKEIPAPEKPGKAKGDTNFLGIPGGIGGLKGAVAKFLPVALGNAIAVAIPLAMAAGAITLQKRDTEDSKKYADRGDYGRAAETFLLGDRERITEETAGSELARTTGKFALAGGAVAGGIAAGGFIAGGGAAAAAGAATAAGAGVAGAAGAAGLAALGAVVPPALIATAIAAAAAAVAKGTQEAYELEYDKNAATIQRDLHRLISDEEAPFLKRIGAGFKSRWIELTSTLAGGIRGVTEVMDVEAERNVQQQLDILKKQADEGNEDSARLYEMMTQQSFREMTKKEKEKLLRSEGLYEEYLTVVSETENGFWEKLKNGAKAVVNGAEGVLDTMYENRKGEITAEWERRQLLDMDKKLNEPGAVDRLKSSEVYLNTLGETGGCV
jgi:hypothetical protein